MPPKKENQGCGCANIPISLILVGLGAGYWGFTRLDHLSISQLLLATQQPPTPHLTPQLNTKPDPKPKANSSPKPNPPADPPATTAKATPASAAPQQPRPPQTPWTKKQIRGIYLSRYQATNNASEQTIRERVRYYRSQGFNTIIHGVWGNGCTMYASDVMQQTFGYKSCPNQYQEKWLDWLIDEAHKQNMQVHAYFERGIKIDKNSPIFDIAVAKRWLVPGIDKTYANLDQYVLNVEVPEVATFFRTISVEFVKEYPTIDAIQWDDYLGYHADLPGKIDRTSHLTKFVRQIRADIKRTNPRVSFDLCHHNPYWGKRYFAADWLNWNIDRVFIQIYNDANFKQELTYAEKYAGVAIADNQFHRLNELVRNTKIKSILVFPTSGKPETAAALVKKATSTSQNRPD